MADERRTGSIYDLGYRRYEGVRLGREQTVLALYIHSLRACFGFGRRAQSKIIPIGLASLVFIPAAIQLGIAAILTEKFEVYTAVGYFTYTQSILGLFAAAVAPEMIGRDQRNHTLSLYFSRALTRTDYAAAKIAAFVTAMLCLTLLPQVLLFVGGGMARNDLLDYFRDEYTQVPAIVTSSLMVSVVITLVALPIAAQTSRRAYATGTILGVFVITSILGGVLSEVGSGGNNFMVLIAPFWILRGFTYWVFGESANSFDPTTLADFPGFFYLFACVVVIGVGGYFFNRRIQKVAA